MNYRSMQIGLLVLVLLTPGCIFQQKTDYYPSSTILTGIGNDWENSKPSEGPNEIYRLRQRSGIFFPFMLGLTYLFLETTPDLLKDGVQFEIPSKDLRGLVCKEVHPGFWCSSAIGHLEVLRIQHNFVDMHIAVKAQAEGNRGTGGDYRWEYDGRLSFNRESYPNPALETLK